MELTTSGTGMIASNLGPTSLQFMDGNLAVTMKVHTSASDSVLLEIFHEGKSLIVNRDGSIAGDLDVDAAALKFWKAIASVHPQVQR